MDIDGFIREKAEMIIWIIHIGVFLWIQGEGIVFSQNINKIIVYAVLGASVYIFIKLHKALIAEQSKPAEIKYLEKPKDAPKESQPFDFKVGK